MASSAKLLISPLAAFYPTVLNSYEGLRQVERRFVELGAMLRFSPAQSFLHIHAGRRCHCC